MDVFQPGPSGLVFIALGEASLPHRYNAELDRIIVSKYSGTKVYMGLIQLVFRSGLILRQEIENLVFLILPSDSVPPYRLKIIQKRY